MPPPSTATDPSDRRHLVRVSSEDARQYNANIAKERTAAKEMKREPDAECMMPAESTVGEHLESMRGIGSRRRNGVDGAMLSSLGASQDPTRALRRRRVPCRGHL